MRGHEGVACLQGPDVHVCLCVHARARGNCQCMHEWTRVCCACTLTMYTPALCVYTCVHASVWICACVAYVYGVCVCMHFVCVCISMHEHVWLSQDVLLKPRVSVWIALRAEPKARPVCVWLFGNVGLRARLPFSSGLWKDKFAWESDHLFLNSLVKFSYKNFWAWCLSGRIGLPFILTFGISLFSISHQISFADYLLHAFQFFGKQFLFNLYYICSCSSF